MTRLTSNFVFAFATAFASLEVTAEPVQLSTIVEAADQLSSCLAAERTKGTAWLEKNGDEAFAELIRLFDDPDVVDQHRAVIAATTLISPWMQGIRQGDNHKGQIELFQPRRPVNRPVDHPQAKAIRQAALVALKLAMNNAAKLRQASAGRQMTQAESTISYQTDELVRELCTCFGEVADEPATATIIALLESESNQYHGSILMRCIDTIYGLPESFQIAGICGNSTVQEMEQFRVSDEARYHESQKAQLAWHKKYSNKPRQQQITAALDLWDETLPKQRYYLSETGDWSTQTFLATLIRMGDDAVEQIRKRAAAAPAEDYWHCGAFHIADGAITQHVDDEFVRRMLNGQTFEQITGCEIIAAAGDKRWKVELAELMKTPSSAHSKASHTLAVVHRSDAISILVQALSDDFVATCSINELQAWGE